MTYNVHSCIGRDGTASTERIAEIIALYGADIICLQELDSGLLRSGKEHQAREIADRLNMEYHFHPALRLEEGEYGNAVLTRYPSSAVRAEALPTLPGRTYREQRGGLWVQVSVDGRPVNVIGTHLGLSHRERLAQSDALLGADWLRNPACTAPVVLCGDLNTIPFFSIVHRRFSSALVDSCHSFGWGRGRTYPSNFPFMRLDHIFLTSDLTVEKVAVPRTKLTRVASDHLPLIVTLAMN